MQPQKQYYRIMAGAKSAFASSFYEEGFIAGYWGIDGDLSTKLTDDWRDFNHEYIPVYLKANPNKTKVAAGLACGMLHTICKGIKIGDIVLTPNGQGQYYIGEVVSDYFYLESDHNKHRRKVRWYQDVLPRDAMSQALKNSSGSIGTVSNITKYADELENLIEGKAPSKLTHSDDTVEDPSVFALEKHLEDFLIANWKSTELGQHYDVYSDEGEIIGQQYQTDTGPIDILAISQDSKTLLVVELKRGRASDVVVGQIQRYMGYIKDELAEPGQQVKGVIIALEDDLKLKRALSVTSNIDFYRYQVSFRLDKGFNNE